MAGWNKRSSAGKGCAHEAGIQEASTYVLVRRAFDRGLIHVRQVGLTSLTGRTVRTHHVDVS